MRYVHVIYSHIKALRQQLVREVRERIPRYDEHRNVYCLEDDNNTEFSDISQWTPVDPSTLPQTPVPCVRSNNNSSDENDESGTNSDIDMQSTPVSPGLNMTSSSSSSDITGLPSMDAEGKEEGKEEESSTSAIIEMPVENGTHTTTTLNDINNTVSIPAVTASSSSLSSLPSSQLASTPSSPPKRLPSYICHYNNTIISLKRCTICHIYQPPRSYHCRFCDV